MPASTYPTRVGLRFRRRVVPAVPLDLRGDQASVATVDLPHETEDVQLVLDWACGSVTELGARVRMVETESRVVNLDVHTVEGDWRPFLRYLGTFTN
jgi:hypothetical protein